jgi:hypothetical protein
MVAGQIASGTLSIWLQNDFLEKGGEAFNFNPAS